MLKVGQKFNRLTIINEIPIRGENERQRECICDCWNKVWASYNALNKEHKKSCWCLATEVKKETQKKNCTKHWLYKKWEYDRFARIYTLMRRRCCNPNSAEYHNYWWRWILCERNNITDFFNDMYPSYTEHVKEFWEKNTTLDRIDNSGNYNKENCRRATYVEQNNNRRDNVHIEIDGENLSIKEFAKEFNIKYDTAKYRIRLYKQGKMSFSTLTRHWKVLS